MTMHPTDAIQALLILANSIPKGQKRDQAVFLLKALREFHTQQEEITRQMVAAFFVQRALKSPSLSDG